MSDYRHGSHTTFSIHLPIVWITKYRHKVLRGEVAEWVRAIVREECQKARVDILQGGVIAPFPKPTPRVAQAERLWPYGRG